MAFSIDRREPGVWISAGTHVGLLALALFIYFFPILAALPLAGPQSFHHWMWLKSWP